jgi:hypothetical protein
VAAVHKYSVTKGSGQPPTPAGPGPESADETEQSANTAEGAIAKTDRKIISRIDACLSLCVLFIFIFPLWKIIIF